MVKRDQMGAELGIVLGELKTGRVGLGQKAHFLSKWEGVDFKIN